MGLFTVSNSYCLRLSVAILLGAGALHALLGARLNTDSAMLLLAPYFVLGATVWLIRTGWVIALALGVLLALEACALAALFTSPSSTGAIVIPLFGIAASGVQLPIAALVAVVRYLQKSP